MTASWQAPGRVNVIGEHTDYNQGLSLPIAIQLGCVARVSDRDDGRLVMRSAQESSPVDIAADGLAPDAVEGWSAYVAGVVWALQQHGYLDRIPGLTIDVDGDVPVGAGLSSSAALECAVGGAVQDLLKLSVTGPDLVRVARTAENDFVGAPTGGLDQLSSVLCRADSALLCDFADLSTRAVPFDIAEHGLALLVIDTKAPHRLVDSEYGERRRSCERAAELLGVPSLRSIETADLPAALERLDDPVLRRRVRHVVTENARVLAAVAALAERDFRLVGELLTASHVSLRDDYQVSVPETDTAVEALLGAGALGARITGGGFGGCVIGLVEADAVEAALDAVSAGFTRAGFGAPAGFTATASAGAHPLAPELTVR